MSTAVEIINGSFRYPGTKNWIFKNLNLKIEKGEILEIAGRNGSGKTTLLKVISNIYTLNKGSFTTGEECAVVYMDQLAGDMLSYNLTIIEQIEAIAVKNTNLSHDTIKEIIKDFNLGLDKRLNEFIGNLSGGQRQIVAFLTAMSSGANMFCLDEFSSYLDKDSLAKIIELIEYLSINNKFTIMYVSHTSLSINSNCYSL